MAAVPRISVVVPIYNVEDYLEPCLRSVAEQTVTDLDVVMVDDGSTDGSADIAREFARSDDRFRLVSQENGGLSKARNTGAAAAGGEYLAFVDSDDVLPANAYELLLGALEKTGSDFASGNVHRLTRFGATQSKFVARVFDETRLKTHVTRFRPLLSDRTAWNKLWRRSFWEKHAFRFPEGRLYEDIPVTLPAHFLAGTVDVLAETVYYWRAREGGELSITERRLEKRALLDRLRSVQDVSETLGRLGPRGAKRWYEETVVADDLRYYMNALDIADDDYVELFLDRVNAYLDRASPRIYDPLPAIERLKWHLVRRRLVPELREVLRFQRTELASTPPVQVRGKWYGDYPFRLDRRLRIPRSVYRLEGELALTAELEAMELDGDRLRLRGHAYIGGIGAATPDAQTVDVSVLRPGRLRRVRLITSAVRQRATATHRPDITAGVRQAMCDLSWSGFEATLDPKRLRRAGRRREGTWELYVTVRASGTKRRRSKFSFGRPLRALRVPVAAAVAVEASITDDAGVALDVRGQAATLRGARELEDGVVELALELLAPPAGKAVLEVRREADRKRRRYPLAGAGLAARVPLGDLLAPAADADEQSAWELSAVVGGRRFPVVADPPLDAVWRAGGRELAGAAGPRGAVLVERHEGPLVDGARWLADGRLELSCRSAGHADELVLSSMGWDEEHAFALGGGRVAVLAPAAIDSLAGPRPLSAGRWELRARRAGEPATHPVAVTDELEAQLPLRTVVDGKRFSFDVLGDGRRALAVQQDLADDERGRYNQRRMRRTVYQDGRSEPLREAVLYMSFGGRQYSDSPRAVHEQLVRREAPLEHLWVVSDLRFPVPEGAVGLREGSREYHEALARARYVVANDFLPDAFVRRPDQVCLQTWHGTPIKRLGADAPTARRRRRRGDLSWQEQPANWQYLVSPNRYSTELLRGAYAFEGEVLETGYPRVDLLTRPDRAQRERDLRRRLGIPDGVRVVLYAPTYRDQVVDRQGRRRLDLRLDFERLRAAVGPDTVFLFRKHHAVFDSAPAAARPYVRDVSTFPDCTELMLAADVLITDYSSAMVDFANTGRPMLFFAYDVDVYESAVRGLYLDLRETAPGPVLGTTDEVADALRDLDRVHAAHAGRYEAFRTRLCEFDDGHATERVVDRVFGG